VINRISKLILNGGNSLSGNVTGYLAVEQSTTACRLYSLSSVMFVPCFVSLLRLPYWRFIGALVAVLWAAEAKQPTTGGRPQALVGEVLRMGSTHRNAAPATVLGEQMALNREAVVTPEFGFNGGFLSDLVVLPTEFNWLVGQFLAPYRVLAVRPSAVPDVFRLRLLLAALSPNAP
jgi:hypothetical protein